MGMPGTRCEPAVGDVTIPKRDTTESHVTIVGDAVCEPVSAVNRGRYPETKGEEGDQYYFLKEK
jgi:hypothetical protein